ncbi:hypothetical protein B296_00031681 [Ensete ventricosum]|uniref:Glycerol-3-phosphate dehydrogenase NAD-dependent N-terminal domain-containing protein n=1 Tax=Ensete ventricosum TaxID=4639 RepID=A0A426Y6I0_ENSVE|nr:hypothetical protein B296_00031681 [Ensete ventricosum]
MVGTVEMNHGSVNSNGSLHNSSGAEEKLDELRRLLGKTDGDLLKIVGVGAGAWGSVFAALLQDAYGHFRDKVQIRIWRRPGRSVDRSTAEHLFEVINSREDVLRRLIRRCAYLKYVEARLGDRTLYADEILRDGFCLNMIDTPFCPLKVVTNLQEAVWDADIVVNGLPSTETREVFEEISRYWKERITVPIIISLAKGIEAALDPVPRIITPTQMIKSASKSFSLFFFNEHELAAGVPIENILYLGGPNIASEIYNKEYANARICGSEKWSKPLAKFLRQPYFIVWDNSDLVTHEVMGGLKNVYAIGAGKFFILLPILLFYPQKGKPYSAIHNCLLKFFVMFRECPSQAILQALQDETMNDPRERIELAQSQAFYRPSLLGQP